MRAATSPDCCGDPCWSSACWASVKVCPVLCLCWSPVTPLCRWAHAHCTDLHAGWTGQHHFLVGARRGAAEQTSPQKTCTSAAQRAPHTHSPTHSFMVQKGKPVNHHMYFCSPNMFLVGDFRGSPAGGESHNSLARDLLTECWSLALRWWEGT